MSEEWTTDRSSYGTSLTCRSCGARLEPDAKFCTQCGTQVLPSPQLDSRTIQSTRRRWLLPAFALVILMVAAGGFMVWYTSQPKSQTSQPIDVGAPSVDLDTAAVVNGKTYAIGGEGPKNTVEEYTPPPQKATRSEADGGVKEKEEGQTQNPKEGRPPDGLSPSPLPTADKNDFSSFLGVWSERWGDVNNRNNIMMTQADGKPKVKMSDDDSWRVWDERFEDGVLTFQIRGGYSNLEFIYSVKRTPSGQMELTVHRLHDGKTFKGELYR